MVVVVVVVVVAVAVAVAVDDDSYYLLPVVPHKAVAEVSRRGKL